MIYFDNSATTKMYPEALDTYRKVNEQFFGNPSSLHRIGNEADALLQQSRKQIAQLLAYSRMRFSSRAAVQRAITGQSKVLRWRSSLPGST